MAGRLLHLTFVMQFKVDLSSSDDTNRRGGNWIYISLVQPAVVIAYLCIPRAIFNLAVTRSELPLNAGVLDRKLAYAAAILLAYRLFWIRWPQLGNRLVRWWLHAEFAAGVIEAGALYHVGVGFSPLFFHHADWAAVTIALRQHRWLIVAGIVTMIGMDRLLSWTLRQQHTFSTTARWALVIVALFGVRSIERLYVDGVTQESPVLGLAVNLRDYANRRAVTANLRVLESERDVLRELGVAPLGAHYQSTLVPPEPLNLITIFIEGGQANFSTPWQPERSVITPNLDRFARRSIRFENCYNAVTPTINALISSHCGVISEIENNHLRLDRGYTRELSCLSDWLHDAGYYQVFMGGADTGSCQRH